MKSGSGPGRTRTLKGAALAVTGAMAVATTARRHNLLLRPSVLTSVCFVVIGVVGIGAVALVTGLDLDHFTWWTWFAHLLFHVLLVRARFADAARPQADVVGLGSSEGTLLFASGPTVHGALSAVAILIAMIPIMDAGIFTAQAEGYSPGIVNVANLVMHYFPVGVFYAVVGARAHVLRAYSLHLYFRWRQLGHAANWYLLLLFTGFLLPSVLPLLYLSVFSFQVSYGVHIASAPIYATGIGAIVVANAVFVLFTSVDVSRMCRPRDSVADLKARQTHNALLFARDPAATMVHTEV